MPRLPFVLLALALTACTVTVAPGTMPSGKPKSPQPSARPTEAAATSAPASPGATATPTADPTGLPATPGPVRQHLEPGQAVFVDRVSGGLCPQGVFCGSQLVVQADGRFTRQDSQGTVEGQLPADVVAALVAAVERADFTELASHQPTGPCPAAADGPASTYSFNLTSGPVSLDECQVDFTQPDAVFGSARALLAAVDAAKTTPVPQPTAGASALKATPVHVVAREGGVAVSDDGLARVVIPPGALTADADVRLERRDTAIIKNGSSFLNGIRLRLDLGGAKVVADQHLTLTARADDRLVPALKGMFADYTADGFNVSRDDQGAYNVTMSYPVHELGPGQRGLTEASQVLPDDPSGQALELASSWGGRPLDWPEVQD